MKCSKPGAPRLDDDPILRTYRPHQDPLASLLFGHAQLDVTNGINLSSFLDILVVVFPFHKSIIPPLEADYNAVWDGSTLVQGAWSW